MCKGRKKKRWKGFTYHNSPNSEMHLALFEDLIINPAAKQHSSTHADKGRFLLQSHCKRRVELAAIITSLVLSSLGCELFFYQNKTWEIPAQILYKKQCSTTGTNRTWPQRWLITRARRLLQTELPTVHVNNMLITSASSALTKYIAF